MLRSQTTLWYVAYGSNMSAARLACYLTGGCPPGGRLTHRGARDATLPRQVARVHAARAVVLRRRVAGLGRRSRVLRPGGPRPHARAGVSRDGRAVRRHPRPGAARLRPPARGRCPRRAPDAHVHQRLRHPMLTFTSTHGRHDVAPTAPTEEYLRTIGEGVAEAHGWGERRVVMYFARVAAEPRKRTDRSNAGGCDLLDDVALRRASTVAAWASGRAHPPDVVERCCGSREYTRRYTRRMLRRHQSYSSGARPPGRDAIAPIARSCSCHHSANRSWKTSIGNPCRDACARGMRSHPKCSTVIRVCTSGLGPVTSSNRTCRSGFLAGRESGVAPAEHESMRRVPVPNVSDDERASITVFFEQPAGRAGFEHHRAGAPRGELEQSVRLPPFADPVGECGERPHGGGAHAHRDENPRRRGHESRSTNFANAASCSVQPRSAVSSQDRNSTIGAERNV